MRTTQPRTLPRRARSLTPGATGRLLTLGLVPVLAASALSVTPSAHASPAAASTAVAPAAAPAVSVVQTGAVPGDGRDDLGAFREAVRRAKAQGRAVSVPRGTYHLSGVLVLDGVTMRGQGRTRTRIVSTDTSAGSIDLIGDGPRLARLKHVVPGVVGRSPEPGRQNINVKYATDFRVRGIHSVGARGAGMLIRRSHRGVVENSIVERTLADGIHMTSGTSNVVVRHNVSRFTGDDGIAVVSYKKDGDVTRHIRIRDNRVYRGKARGIAVVGGRDVRVLRNTVRASEAGGIYIAAEIEWNTFGTRNIGVRRNRVVNAPSRNSHASVLVYSSEMLVNNVRFGGNHVRGARNVGFGAWDHESRGGRIGDLYYTGNVVRNVENGAWARSYFKRGKVHLRRNRGF